MEGTKADAVALTDGDEVLLSAPDAPLRPDESLFLAAVGVPEHDFEATAGAVDMGAERCCSQHGFGNGRRAAE